VNKGGSKRSFITDLLKERRDAHKLRTLTVQEYHSENKYALKEGRELINFCSNDYLGLSSHPALKERSVRYTQEYGTSASSSRLISGTLKIHQDLEKKIADRMGYEAALLFNSGFQANTSILPAICDRHSLILMDKLCHNSLIQGALLSRATVQRFRHNDLDHLMKLVEKARSTAYNRIVVVTETVFSMDGDQSPIEMIREICTKHDLLLYSDDAHAFGLFGKDGMGFNATFPETDIALGTFGKSAGSFGAFAACTHEMKQYLINFAPGLIYSTALPPGVVGALDAAFDIIPEMHEERKSLLQNVDFLKKSLQAIGFETGRSHSQILPVLIGDEHEVLELTQFLDEKGYWVSAIRPPTVPEGSSRIRITMSVKHTQEDIDQLVDAFRQWKSR